MPAIEALLISFTTTYECLMTHISLSLQAVHYLGPANLAALIIDLILVQVHSVRDRVAADQAVHYLGPANLVALIIDPTHPHLLLHYGCTRTGSTVAQAADAEFYWLRLDSALIGRFYPFQFHGLTERQLKSASVIYCVIWVPFCLIAIL